MPPDITTAAPGTGTAAHTQPNTHQTGASTRATISSPVGVRRRREAAHRLPPLAGGDRDPLDGLAGLPVRTIDYAGYDVTDLGLDCDHGDACPARAAAAS